VHWFIRISFQAIVNRLFLSSNSLILFSQLTVDPFHEPAPGLIVAFDLLLDNCPSGGAILVFHLYQPVDYPVYLLLVLLGNLNSDLLKNVLHVSKVAGHHMPPYLFAVK